MMSKISFIAITIAQIILVLGGTLEPLRAQGIAGFRFMTRYDAGGANAAEVAAWHSRSRTAFVINGKDKTLDLVSLSDISHNVPLIAKSKLNLAEAAAEIGVEFGDATSVAVSPDGSSIAVAVQDKDYTQPGCVLFLDSNGTVTSGVMVGVQPDMICFAGSDGKTLLTANEGEPRGGYGKGAFDPPGSVSVVRLDNGIPVSTQVGFEEFTSQDLLSRGVILQTTRNDGKVLGHIPPSIDLEPEYIAVDDDGRFAWVSLQEANAIAKLNVEDGRFEWVKGLPRKDHSLPENALDLAKDNMGMLAEYPVKGLLMPDAIALYETQDRIYLVTANEGSHREWPLRPNDEPDKKHPSFYVNKQKLSRIKNKELSSALSAAQRNFVYLAKTDGSPYEEVTIHADASRDDKGQINELYTFGGRSFSIFDAQTLDMVYDSGSAFERHIAKTLPRYFNVSDDNLIIDSRSGSKGPEPEGVIVARHGKSVYAMVGLERIGGFMVYDITNPSAPTFICHANSRDYSGKISGDSGPEGLVWISAVESPTNTPLVLLANEISGTLAVFEAVELAHTHSLGDSKKPASSE